METLDEFNKRRWMEYHKQENKLRSKVKNGIACPECGEELYDVAPMITLTSARPRKTLSVLSADIGATESRKMLNRRWCMKCRKCHRGTMRKGVGLRNTLTGIGGFHDDDKIVTLSPGGPGKLIEVLKCDRCGYSITPSASQATE